MTNDDMELVRQYAARQSESAFATLVSRHASLVYSAALRQVRDPQLAEEITQAVFVILARKSGALNEKTILPGWLYRTTCYASKSARKREQRRQQREQEAYMQSTLHEARTDADWKEMSPLLEEAMLRLGHTDRDALVLRFFEGRSLSEVGTALGASEDAAKKRVNRALAKLHRYFSQHGVSSTTGIIAGGLSANSVHAAPAALAKSVTAVAITKGAAGSGSTLALIKGALKLMAWTKAKTAIVVGAGVLLAVGTTSVVVREARPRIDDKWFELTGARLAPSNLLIIRPTRFQPGHFSGTLELSPGELGQRLSLKDMLFTAYGLSGVEHGYSLVRAILPQDLPPGYFDYLVTFPGDFKKEFRTKIKRQFGLIGRMETIETNVLLLELQTPRAPGLTPSQGGRRWVTFNDAGELCGTNAPISTVAGYMETKFYIPVVDKTGLEENFDFVLHYPLGTSRADEESLKISLLNDLGLKLVPGREPVEMLVVDKVK